jgi:hypothetical protein
MLVISRQLKKLSPFVDWDRVHDDYMIATYSKDPNRKRSLKQRERPRRKKGQRRHQWQLAMMEANVKKQEEEAIEKFSLSHQDKGIKKEGGDRPKHTWGAKANKGLSKTGQIQFPKEVSKDNTWSDATPPSIAPISAIPIAATTMDTPSAGTPPLAPTVMESPSAANPPPSDSSLVLPESKKVKKGTMKRQFSQNMGNSAGRNPKGFIKQQKNSNESTNIIPTTSNDLVDEFSKENPTAPNSPWSSQTPVTSPSNILPSDPLTETKKDSSTTLSVDQNSSKPLLQEDEFSLESHSKIIDGESMHDAIGNILEDAKSMVQMDQRQGDEASFNGKPIPVYTYDKGNCPDVGDVAKLPCAPDDLKKLCDKYDDMGSFRKCFDACKPSFCCIHGKITY